MDLLKFHFSFLLAQVHVCITTAAIGKEINQYNEIKWIFLQGIKDLPTKAVPLRGDKPTVSLQQYPQRFYLPQLYHAKAEAGMKLQGY